MLPAPDGFVLVHDSEREIEVYGESASKPIFSAAFPAAMDRSLQLAKSELRLDPDTQASALRDLLPNPVVFPPDHDPSSSDFQLHIMPYATALFGACQWLGLEANLLPESQRKGSSRVRLIPTFALGATLFVMLAALGAQSRWADGRYLGLLQHEIRKLEPQARKVDSLDKDVTLTRARSQLLDEYRRRAEQDMDALTEITKLIPPPGWVGSLEMDRQSLQLAGEADQAAGLLKVLDNSRLFERSEFTMPITRTPSGDTFRLKALRTPNGVSIPSEAPPAQAAASAPAAAPAQSFSAPVAQPQQPVVPSPVLLPPGFQRAQPSTGAPR